RTIHSASRRPIPEVIQLRDNVGLPFSEEVEIMCDLSKVRLPHYMKDIIINSDLIIVGSDKERSMWARNLACLISHISRLNCWSSIDTYTQLPYALSMLEQRIKGDGKVLYSTILPLDKLIQENIHLIPSR